MFMSRKLFCIRDIEVLLAFCVPRKAPGRNMHHCGLRVNGSFQKSGPHNAEG